MKPKTVILMIVAVSCGLGASFMTSRLLAQRGKGESEEKVKVLVAKKNIEQGSSLKTPDEMFEAKEFLRGTEPKDAIVNLAEVKNKVLKRSLRAGDPLTQEILLPEGMVGLSGHMSSGYRAVGVRVNLESGAAGWATLPLSRVDLISTVRRGSDRDSFSHVLLENVLVLAVDANKERDDQGRAMPGNVVILALKPEDVLKVNMAKEMGPLSLALRKFRDETKTDVDKITVEQMITKTVPKGEVEELLPKSAPKAVVSEPVAAAKPVTETKPAPEPKVVADEYRPRQHILTITEGSETRQAKYYVDDKGNVISQESALTDGPPRPAPEAAPNQPEANPVVPPGKNEDQ